jgi:iron complex outermembrane receptor protein
MVRVARLAVFVCLFSFGASTYVRAQQLSISGTVDDGDGIVPDVTVTLRDSRGVSTEVTTDSAGKYQMDGLRPGEYQLIVGREGYATATRTVVLTEESRTVDITLQVGGFGTSVDVVGSAGAALTNSLIASTNAGSRLALTALDTPASVTTLSGTDIRLRGDLSVNSAVTRAVGVTSTMSTSGGGNTVAVRGFGGSSISFTYDGIRNQAGLGNLGWPYDPWTVDRIEVLNGPSSVLFGIGGIGGSINIVPRRPSLRTENTVRVAAASYGTYRLALDSTGPMGSDRVLYRVDLSRQASNGYFDRGTSESTAVSGSVDFLISDTLKATLMNDYAYIEPLNYNGLPMVNGETSEALLKNNYATSDVDVHFHENSTRFELNWTPNARVTVRNITSALLGDRLWQMGPSQLQYRSATNDVLRTGFGKFEQDQTQWNNQLELTFKHQLAGYENAFVVGTDAEWLDFTRYVTQWSGISDAVSLLSPAAGNYPTVAGTLTQAQTNDIFRYSLFAENHVKLSKALAVVGGLRWDHQDFDRIDLVAPDRPVAEKTYTPINWRAGAVYEVARDTTLYAQYSAATDALSNACCITAAQMEFSASRGTQVEAGIKRVTGRTEWTFAAYRIVKNDLLVPDPFTIATLIQVGAQSSTGLEATLAVDLGHGVRLGANATALDPQYDEFYENVGGVRVSRNGNRPTNVPWQSGNLLATWTFRQYWMAQGTVRYVGDRYINTANTLVLPSYTVVDVGLRRSLPRNMALDFRIANLTDAFYPYNFTGNGLGGGNWNVGMPRSFEVSLTAGF